MLKRMLLWGEARGESPRGKLAVLWVALNRAKLWRKSLKEVILQPLQFSCFNSHDPNRVKLLSAWKDDPEQWAVIDALVELVSGQSVPDPTYGAVNYYAHNVVKPEWGEGHPGWRTTAVIENHTFGKAA